jgi:hypothetical protein
MGTAQAIFAGEQWGATGSDVTGSDVSHVTGSDVTGLHVTFLSHFFPVLSRKKSTGKKVRKISTEKSTGKLVRVKRTKIKI